MRCQRKKHLEESPESRGGGGGSAIGPSPPVWRGQPAPLSPTGRGAREGARWGAGQRVLPSALTGHGDAAVLELSLADEADGRIIGLVEKFLLGKLERVEDEVGDSLGVHNRDVVSTWAGGVWR